MNLQKNLIYTILSCFLLTLCFYSKAFADKPSPSMPYYASIKSEEVNVRIGPNVRYPIKWVFVKKNEPVEVVASYEQWRKIRDINGDEGWVNLSMLSGKRFIITVGTKKIPLFKNSDDSSKIIAEAQPELRGVLMSCNTSFCLVDIQKNKGWISRKNLWGIYKEEEIK